MELNPEEIKRLRRVKEEIEEILEDVSEIMPEDFRMTCLLRYCGYEDGVDHMMWTDDARGDAVKAMNQKFDELESL